MDEQGESPPVSRDNTPNSNLMDVDHHPLDNTTWSEDGFLGHDQLQEDKKDDDGVPVSLCLESIIHYLTVSSGSPVF